MLADRILVVDDERDTLNLMKMILTKEGYEVSLASNGVEALQKAEAEQPDLVLLDVIMPAKNGWTVCKTLKTQDKTKHIPVVIFTVLSNVLGDELSRKHALECGCDGYLAKPFDSEQLLTEVKKHLHQAKE